MSELDWYRIQELKKQAEDRGLCGKVYTICEYLGEETPKKHGAIMTYKNGSLSLWADTYVTECWVDWNEERVFYMHLGRVSGYKPSVPDWESFLDEEYSTKALPLKTRRESEAQEKEAADLSRRWG